MSRTETDTIPKTVNLDVAQVEADLQLVAHGAGRRQIVSLGHEMAVPGVAGGKTDYDPVGFRSLAYFFAFAMIRWLDQQVQKTMQEPTDLAVQLPGLLTRPSAPQNVFPSPTHESMTRVAFAVMG